MAAPAPSSSESPLLLRRTVSGQLQQAPQPHPLASPSQRSSRMSKNLFLLVRILFQYLERIDKIMLNFAMEILKDCERKQKTNDSKFDNLADAIKERVRNTVGEEHWTQALKIRKQLILNRENKTKMDTEYEYRIERMAFQIYQNYNQKHDPQQQHDHHHHQVEEEDQYHHRHHHHQEQHVAMEQNQNNTVITTSDNSNDCAIGRLQLLPTKKRGEMDKALHRLSSTTSARSCNSETSFSASFTSTLSYASSSGNE